LRYALFVVSDNPIHCAWPIDTGSGDLAILTRQLPFRFLDGVGPPAIVRHAWCHDSPVFRLLPVDGSKCAIPFDVYSFKTTYPTDLDICV